MGRTDLFITMIQVARDYGQPTAWPEVPGKTTLSNQDVSPGAKKYDYLTQGGGKSEKYRHRYTLSSTRNVGFLMLISSPGSTQRIR